MDKYWNKIKDQNYLKESLSLIREILPKQSSILDVGTGPTLYLNRISADYNITALDKGEHEIWKQLAKNIIQCRLDFFQLNPGFQFDLIMALECLEHIAEMQKKEFIDRLFDHSKKYVLISLPYMWKASKTKGHIGITKEIILSWFDREPARSKLILDNEIHRILNLYIK